MTQFPAISYKPKHNGCDPVRILSEMCSNPWQRLEEDPCISCVVDFLSEYFDIARAEKATDEQLFTTAEKTKRLATKAIEANNTIVEWQKNELEKLGREGRKPGGITPEMMQSILEQQREQGNKLKSIIDDAENAVRNKNRLAALTAIERLAVMSHDTGYVLAQWACDCPEGPYRDLPGEVIFKTLECLAGE